MATADDALTKLEEKKVSSKGNGIIVEGYSKVQDLYFSRGTSVAAFLVVVQYCNDNNDGHFLGKQQ